MQELRSKWYMKITFRVKGKLKCVKHNHFGIFCRNRRVDTAENIDDNIALYLGATCPKERQWQAQLKLSGKGCQCKIDFGVNVLIMSLEQYHKLSLKPSVRLTKSMLRSLGGTMKCLRQFTTPLCDDADGTISLRRVYVDVDTDNLLCRSAVCGL